MNTIRMRNRVRLAQRRGMSLLEVLVAMGMLSVGALAAGGLVTYIVKSSSNARKLTNAQLVGNEILERLRTEVRYDSEPRSRGTTTISGITGTSEFSTTNAWMADRYPYDSTDTVAASTGALRTCNPSPGANDSQNYPVGPFPVMFEGNTYYVCTRMAPNTVNNLPAGTMDATVKVIWRNPGGFSSRTVTGVLMSGR